MFCSTCGSKLSRNECPKCGTRQGPVDLRSIPWIPILSGLLLLSLFLPWYGSYNAVDVLSLGRRDIARTHGSEVKMFLPYIATALMLIGGVANLYAAATGDARLLRGSPRFAGVMAVVNVLAFTAAAGSFNFQSGPLLSIIVGGGLLLVARNR